MINSCSYLLGIGDRHSENFLLDMTRVRCVDVPSFATDLCILCRYRGGQGELVLIDFGHSFGSATQNLPVPELIPFRLTRQMTTFMGLLGTGGIYTSTMAHALDSLQEQKYRLLNAMDVFVKDPLLDWKKDLATREKKGSFGAA